MREDGLAAPILHDLLRDARRVERRLSIEGGCALGPHTVIVARLQGVACFRSGQRVDWGTGRTGHTWTGHRQPGHRLRRSGPLVAASAPSQRDAGTDVRAIRPARRSRRARAVGRDARVGVHLAIEFGDEEKRDPGAQRCHHLRARPDLRQAVEPIPHRLRARADLVGPQGGMR